MTLRAPVPSVRWGVVLGAMVAGFVAGEVLGTVLVGVLAGAYHYPGGLSALAHASAPPWWFVAGSLVGLWAGFAGAIYLARTHGHLAPLPGQWRFRPGDVAYVVLGVVLQIGVDLAYRPWHISHLNQPVTHLFGGASGASAALIAAMTLVGAPFMEEMFFRGLVFRGIAGALHARERGLALWVAVILSALLFALAHGEAAQFAGLALVGVVLALLVVRTQRLAPSFLTHASFNAVALAALFSQRAH